MSEDEYLLEERGSVENATVPYGDFIRKLENELDSSSYYTFICMRLTDSDPLVCKASVFYFVSRVTRLEMAFKLRATGCAVVLVKPPRMMR